MILMVTIVIFVQNYFYCTDISFALPMYFVIIVPLTIAVVGTSLIYCHNWICGEIIIFIYIALCEIYITIYHWGIIEKLFLSFNHILALICIGSCIRFLEYKRRENFFRMESLTKMMEASKKILMNLPDPIIVVEHKEIILVNNEYNDFCKKQVH